MCPYCTSSRNLSRDSDIPLCWKVRSRLQNIFGGSKREVISSAHCSSSIMLDTFSPRSKSSTKISAFLTNKFCSNSSPEIALLSSDSTSAAGGPYPFRLDARHIRVLLYRECDRRGRKLLYDSRTVIRIPLKHGHQVPSDKQALQCRSSRLSSNKYSLGPLSSPKHCLSTSRIPSSQTCCTGNKSTSCGALPKNSYKKQDCNKTGSSFAEVRNGFGYQYQKDLPDTKSVGEQVFGAVALAYKGPSAKIHVMSDPSGILISKTCGAPRGYKSPQISCDNCLEDSFSSLSSSLSDLHMTKVESLEGSLNRPSLKPSIPVEMHAGGVRACQSEEDSGYSGPPSPFSSTCGSYLTPASLTSGASSVGSPSSRNGSGNSLKNSGSSINSLQRRFLRNVSTSLDSFGFRSEEDHREETVLAVDRKKLGFAVLIETEQEDSDTERQFKEWIFSFQAAVELSLTKLQSTVETAYVHSSTFVSVVYDAVSQFQQELCDLVCAPRLQDPLWLSVLGASSEKEIENSYSRLSESLSFLLNKCDTKHTNFFISKLLTAVLTNHLGWVSTVAPPTSSIPEFSANDYQFSSSKLVHNLVNCFSKFQPYNALWGQLYELTGSIGYPSRMAKTIVVGTDCTILNQILILLSYFIRCSKVEENIFKSTETEDCSRLDTSSKFSSKLFTPSNSKEIATSPLLHSQSASVLQDGNQLNKRGSYKENKDLTNLNSSRDLSSCTIKSSTHDKMAVINNLIDNSSVKVITADAPDNEWRFHPEQKNSTNQSVQSSLPKVLEHSSIHSRFITKSDALLIAPAIQGLHTSHTLSDFTSFNVSESVSPQDSHSPVLASSCVGSTLYPNLKDLESQTHSIPLVNMEPTIVTEKFSQLSNPSSKTNGLPYKLEESSLVVVSGKDIEVEMEKGGKVLFILGENERLEGLKPKKECLKPLQYNSTKILQKSETKLQVISSVASKDGNGLFITALPPPVDLIRVENFRRQGKSATSLDYKSICKNTVNVYPSLMELKKDLSDITLQFSKTNKSHRRTASDTTSGIICRSVAADLKDKFNSKTEKNNSKDVLDASLNQAKKENPVAKLDELSLQVVEMPRVEIVAKESPKVAESLIGGILDHYSSLFILHATTNSVKLEDQLRIDLATSSHNPVLDSQTLESVAIVAETEKWEIELVSSHSFAVDRRTPQDGPSHISYGGIPIMISPLVSEITDRISNLTRVGAPSKLIAHCFEHHLREVYLKSKLLSQYLLEGTQMHMGHSGTLSYFGGQGPYHLTELTHNLGIDLNDLPLLLSVASTHTPALTQMFGLTFK